MSEAYNLIKAGYEAIYKDKESKEINLELHDILEPEKKKELPGFKSAINLIAEGYSKSEKNKK
ncbi:hypothetical protein [Desulforamulus aquiferis]|uniref:Uncharacterized protein n=1 Tax=Desulforamulus aquiferis TaxID=1397668 RepID=A0AAW7ZBD3_9FIRM|nr:hypothetical protein [Desulforamulus aquiferis]MDO7786994.1 hypothetical protein [Desulforamulus aquiferis]